MQTYWVRLCCEDEITLDVIDNWKTGYPEKEGWKMICFAVRADDEDDIYDLLTDLLCSGTYEVDFAEEQDWVKYGDFAGPDTRFPMAAKFLKEEIDTIEVIRSRL